MNNEIKNIQKKISYILKLIEENNSVAHRTDCEVVTIGKFLLKELSKLYKEEKVFMEKNKRWDLCQGWHFIF